MKCDLRNAVWMAKSAIQPKESELNILNLFKKCKHVVFQVWSANST